MPGMSGYEAARKIRDRFGDGLLLVAMTGIYKTGSDRILSELVGFNHHLVKPYLTADVLRLLAPLRLPQPRA